VLRVVEVKRIKTEETVYDFVENNSDIDGAWHVMKARKV